MRKAVRLALLQPNCSAILVLFDADGDPPCILGPSTQGWAQAEAGAIPCAVVMAKQEYEAWFLATIESLRGRRGIGPNAVPHPDPESPLGAKEQLEDRMSGSSGYVETADQAALSAVFDLATAHQRCRSFRRMVRAYGLLATSTGTPLAEWPPPAWLASGPS